MKNREESCVLHICQPCYRELHRSALHKDERKLAVDQYFVLPLNYKLATNLLLAFSTCILWGLEKRINAICPTYELQSKSGSRESCSSKNLARSDLVANTRGNAWDTAHLMVSLLSSLVAYFHVCRSVHYITRHRSCVHPATPLQWASQSSSTSALKCCMRISDAITTAVLSLNNCPLYIHFQCCISVNGLLHSNISLQLTKLFASWLSRQNEDMTTLVSLNTPVLHFWLSTGNIYFPRTKMPRWHYVGVASVSRADETVTSSSSSSPRVRCVKTL